VAAALSVRGLLRRSNFYVPVLIIALGYLAAALALGLAGNWSIAEIGLRGVWGAANGLVAAGLSFFLLPLAESVTAITTDLTLLELSDPSRPLLRRLSLEAPGTYAHSVAMANLVEAACNRIGANGLLGRVGCYYHDIGKVKNPQYFVENQTRGNNPHDRLKAYQSAEIIRAHVTDGLVLARAAGLPEAVAAFIPEHHGTTEITYFLDRAKKSGDGKSPNPSDFAYPGPKPHSKETAITMLADSVEAALRVLAWERADGARVELTLLDGAAMRRLNRRATGRRGLTDVIAFALPQPDGTLVGDVYICPEAARRWVDSVPRPTPHVPPSGR